MYNLRKTLSYTFLFLFFTFSFISSAFCGFFKEYDDSDGHRISISITPKENPLWDKYRGVFVATFVDNYSGLEPNQIKPNFKIPKDVREWLEGVFTEEEKYFSNAKHPIELVSIFKEVDLIGFAIVEQWKDEAKTIHLRQMAILPKEQRHGYGQALVDALRGRADWPIDRIVADTRKLNQKALDFYEKLGFRRCDTQDPELNPELYTGIEWVKEAKEK